MRQNRVRIDREIHKDGDVLPFIQQLKRGHITIPVRIRITLGWEDGDQIGFTFTGNGLRLYRVRVVPGDEHA